DRNDRADDQSDDRDGCGLAHPRFPPLGTTTMPEHSASAAPDASCRTVLDSRCRKSRIIRRKSQDWDAAGVAAASFVGRSRRGQIPLVVISPEGSGASGGRWL